MIDDQTQDPDPLAQLKAMKAQAAPAGDPLEQLKAMKAQKPAPADGPGLLSRVASDVVSGAKNLIAHPLDTITAPIKSAFDAVVSPGVGEARPDPRASKGGNSGNAPINAAPYDAEHGGITPTQRTQAGVQSLVNAAIPGIAGGVTKAVGSKVAGAVVAGAAGGAAYNPTDPVAGAMAGAALAPVADVGARGIGRVANAGVDLAKTANRVRTAAPLGDAALAASDARVSADEANYGKAEQEGQATPTTPALQAAFDHPRIKPYVDLYRASDAGQGASDAQVARVADKLMTSDRLALEKKNTLPGEYDPGADLKAQDLKSAQRVLRKAASTASTIPASLTETPPVIQKGHDSLAGPIVDAPLATYTDPGPTTLSQGLRTHTEGASPPPPMQGPGGVGFRVKGTPDQIVKPGVATYTPEQQVPASMPSFPTAIAEHARLTGNMKSLELGADQAKRIMNGTPIPGKYLTTRGGPAFLRQIEGSPSESGMSSDDAQSATRGVLGRGQEGAALELPTIHSPLGGAVDAAAKINRLRPYLAALDAQSGVQQSGLSKIDFTKMQPLPFVGGALAPRDSTP